jgi:hypothetical protein
VGIVPRFRRSVVAVWIAVFVAALALSTVAAAVMNRDHQRTLNAHHAIVRKPASIVTRTLAPDQGCQVLLDTGDGDCRAITTAHGTIVVTVEPGAPVDPGLVSRPWIVRVYGPDTTVKDGWSIALSTRPSGADPGPLYANVTAIAADVTGDGHDELLVGYRSEGTGQILDVDIVGTTRAGAPKVLAHDQLYKGTVVAKHGRIVTYTPVYRGSDANCCPTFIERDTIRFHDGAFHVEPGPRTPTKRAHIPPGDLD